jgi:hypothetical protein
MAIARHSEGERKSVTLFYEDLVTDTAPCGVEVYPVVPSELLY